MLKVSSPKKMASVSSSIGERYRLQQALVLLPKAQKTAQKELSRQKLISLKNYQELSRSENWSVNSFTRATWESIWAVPWPKAISSFSKELLTQVKPAWLRTVSSSSFLRVKITWRFMWACSRMLARDWWAGLLTSASLEVCASASTNQSPLSRQKQMPCSLHWLPWKPARILTKFYLSLTMSCYTNSRSNTFTDWQINHSLQLTS